MTSTHIDLTEADLQETLAQIWLAYLDPETVPVPAWDPVDEAAWTAQVRVRAAADIRGAWEGTATVEMGLQLALDVAAALYAQPVAALSGEVGRAEQSLIFDAVGEVVNIVAGNLKALLPQPSTLSLPRVEFPPTVATSPAAQTPTLLAPKTANGVVVDFLCGDQPLRLTVHPHGTD